MLRAWRKVERVVARDWNVRGGAEEEGRLVKPKLGKSGAMRR